MADPVCKPVLKAQADPTFIVDAAYMKREAREAARIFLAPFSGIYRALRSDR